MRLAGKIGIVTAAASGMGRAGALRFAREGAQVAVVDVDAAGVERAVSEITAAGPGCPTWFHTKSRPLKRATVSHTMRRESSSRVRSAGMPKAVPPAEVISPTTRCTPAASTSTTATCAPSRAKRRAPARPMPEAAAVTIPIFPARRISGDSIPREGRGKQRRA